MKQYCSIFIIALVMTNVSAEGQYKKFGHGKVIFSEQDLTVDVEIARTEIQRATGLMDREYLAPTKGMLFIFEQEAIQRVWMKDTLIPLDVVFISAHGKVVSIIKDLQPCIKKTCDIYDSTKRAIYMLEVNAGIVSSKGIKTGQRLIIRDDLYAG